MNNIKRYTDYLRESQEETPEELGQRLIEIIDHITPDIKEVKRLIRAGADLEEKTGTGWTSLHTAAAGGHAEIVNALIEAGAELEAKDDDGWTSLHFTAYWGRTEAVKALIEAGAELEARDNDGWTPLQYAALHGRTEAAKALIGAGADISAGFGSLDKLEDLFGGDIAWIPQERIPPEWRKRHRSRGAFGRF